MFGLGLSEILVIGLFFIVMYSPKKIPQTLKSFARFIVQSRRTINEIRYNTLNEIEKFGQEELKPLSKMSKTIEENITALGNNIDKVTKAEVTKKPQKTLVGLKKPPSMKRRSQKRPKKKSSKASSPGVKFTNKN